MILIQEGAMPPREEHELDMNRLRTACQNAGIKLTHQRMEIFREVAKNSGHPDAESVYKSVRERVPTVSLDTVYRTLWLLTDLGLITTLGSRHERVRFDANVKPHHHFICTRCGKAFDFYSPEFDRLAVPGPVNKLGRVQTSHVELRGVCAECAKREDGG